MIRTFYDIKIWMLLACLFQVVSMTSCTPKKQDAVPIGTKNDDRILTISQTIVLKPANDQKVRIKSQAQIFKFLASLETEILKLIIPTALPAVNQFDVLSYAFDLQAQIKRPSLKSYECQKINLITTEKKITVMSECEKPFKVLAEIDVLSDKLYVVKFINASWTSVVGLSATLQADPRECIVKVKLNTPLEMDCRNTSYTIKADSHLQDLKIKKYNYSYKINNSKNENEVLIEAGIYKNLIEIKKIKMTVPFSGKIKIIEKEIEVKDDFANENGLEYKEAPKNEVKEEVTNEATNEVIQPSR